MKNFKLNPLATTVELEITTSIQNLETEGFDFEEYHENRSESKGIAIEQARDENYQIFEAKLRLIDGGTFVAWDNVEENESGEMEDTGNDEETIKNIINMLNQGIITIDDNYDRSRDADGNYISTFIEA